MSARKKIVIGISGASGSIYGRTAVSALLELGAEVHLIMSTIAKQVWNFELKQSVKEFINSLPAEYKDRLHVENNADLGAKMSSGSFRHDGMIIIPCSVKCMAGIANNTRTSNGLHFS